ncbi:hypothetical protein, partial [Brevundimonas sp.]|uniref:hypothetical protein n=1 Tax=Brevundimonas sp. TaxID=1871086 RepID=UPI00391969F1
MDYSLLVGVHRSRIPAPAPPARSPDQDCRHQFRTELGGMCADSVDGPCVYFIGARPLRRRG